MKTFSEFGFGNGDVVSTEFEFNGCEFRVKGFYGLSKDPYIRIWMGKRVVVISKHGVKIVRKSYNAIKFVVGFAGGEI